MGNERINADPCLYYNWNHDGLKVWVRWKKKGIELQWKKMIKKIWLHGGMWDERICQMQNWMQLGRVTIKDDANNTYTKFGR